MGKKRKSKLDVLDYMQDEVGLMKVRLTDGSVIYGVADCIVMDEDEEGFDTIRNIKFNVLGKNPIFLYPEDIKSYEMVKVK